MILTFTIKRVEDYYEILDDLGDGSRWAVYRVTVEDIEGNFHEGSMQGDTHNWYYPSFEPEGY